MMVLALGLLAATARAAEESGLTVSRAKLCFRKSRASGPRDSLVLRASLPTQGIPVSYDPVEDGLRVTIGAVAVFTVPAAGVEPKVKGRSGVRRIRLPGRKLVWRPSGSLKVKARRLGLSSIEDPDDVPLEIRVGARTFTKRLGFYVSRGRVWLLISQRDGDGSPPDDGGPGPTPVPPGPDDDRQPLEWRVIARGRDSSFQIAPPNRAEVRVVRDQAGWDALWTEHRGYGSPPAVDFANEMVVGFFCQDTGGGPDGDGPELLCATVGKTEALFRYFLVSWPMPSAPPPNESYEIVAATPVSVPVRYEEKWLSYVTWQTEGVPPEWRDCE
ncbi:MAG: hypothetical protein ACYTDY_00550 [Planctomycetota bacterium]|jgi:hypothetical protein